MTELRAQAERFGAEIIQGDVTSVDLSNRPFVVNVERPSTRAGADCRHRRVGQVARPWRRQEIVRPRRLDVRDVRWLFLQGSAVAVIGGGDTAMEEAIYLSKLASR